MHHFSNKKWILMAIVLFAGTVCLAGGIDTRNPNFSTADRIGMSGSSAGDRANPLEIDTNKLPARTGGIVNFTLDAGSANAYRIYIMFGTSSGTSPGLILPSGKILPINWDCFSEYILMNINTPPFYNFVGLLDLAGTAQAQMDTTMMGPVSPGCIGKKLNFAFVTSCHWDFVSNPVEIEIVP